MHNSYFSSPVSSPWKVLYQGEVKLVRLRLILLYKANCADQNMNWDPIF